MNDHLNESDSLKSPVSAAKARRIRRLKKLSGAKNMAQLELVLFELAELLLDNAYGQISSGVMANNGRKTFVPFEHDALKHAKELGRPLTDEELEEARPLVEAAILHFTPRKGVE